MGQIHTKGKLLLFADRMIVYYTVSDVVVRITLVKLVTAAISMLSKKWNTLTPRLLDMLFPRNIFCWLIANVLFNQEWTCFQSSHLIQSKVAKATTLEALESNDSLRLSIRSLPTTNYTSRSNEMRICANLHVGALNAVLIVEWLSVWMSVRGHFITNEFEWVYIWAIVCVCLCDRKHTRESARDLYQ